MPDRDILGEVTPAIPMKSTGDRWRKVGNNRIVDVKSTGLTQHQGDGRIVQLVDTRNKEGCILDKAAAGGGHAFGTDPLERAITAFDRDDCLPDLLPSGETTKQAVQPLGRRVCAVAHRLVSVMVILPMQLPPVIFQNPRYRVRHPR
jgi:hypothetical protein